MKVGYIILNGVCEGENIIEVINNLDKNEVVHLGWIKQKSAYSFKSKNTVGVWKIKNKKL